MYLTKLDNGDYRPTHNSDYEASKKVKAGSEVKASRPRNVKFHKKGFALLKLGFDNQEKYDNFDIYRQVVTMKAGFVNWVEGKDGNVPLPQSLSFDSMSAEDFDRWYSAVKDVICKELGVEDIESEIGEFF